LAGKEYPTTEEKQQSSQACAFADIEKRVLRETNELIAILFTSVETAVKSKDL